MMSEVDETAEAEAKPPRPLNGTGDIAAVFFEAIGIAALVKYLAARRKQTCRCPIRQEQMNIRFWGLWVWLWDWRFIWWCPCN